MCATTVEVQSREAPSRQGTREVNAGPLTECSWQGVGVLLECCRRTFWDPRPGLGHLPEMPEPPHSRLPRVSVSCIPVQGRASLLLTPESVNALGMSGVLLFMPSRGSRVKYLPGVCFALGRKANMRVGVFHDLSQST